MATDGETTSVPVSIGSRPLHPRHGVQRPAGATTRRVPGSVRRTSTVDSLRPHGLLEDLVQVGAARDLVTRPDGTTEIAGEATVDALIAYTHRYELRELVSSPHLEALSELIGRSVSTGFRAAVADAVPDEKTRGTLLHLLLDDLPGAALVSGYAIGHASEVPIQKDDWVSLQVSDLCAGFRRGGTIMMEVDAGQRPPIVTGPVAPSVLPVDDPLAWHAILPLPAHGMRRWRRLDLLAGEPLRADVFFRDSHVAADGVETVIHEYSVTVDIDPRTLVVVASSASAGSLPWIECIEAEASAARIVGQPLGELRAMVRQELVGITTCTHLNDTLRSLDDVLALVPLLP